MICEHFDNVADFEDALGALAQYWDAGDAYNTCDFIDIREIRLRGREIGCVESFDCGGGVWERWHFFGMFGAALSWSLEGRGPIDIAHFA